MKTFAEKMAEYLYRMNVLSMTREQLEADPRAMSKLREIKAMIDADPHNEVCEGLRPRVEHLLAQGE